MGGWINKLMKEIKKKKNCNSKNLRINNSRYSLYKPRANTTSGKNTRRLSCKARQWT